MIVWYGLYQYYLIRVEEPEPNPSPFIRIHSRFRQILSGQKLNCSFMEC
jgi:hypothetical protein